MTQNKLAWKRQVAAWGLLLLASSTVWGQPGGAAMDCGSFPESNCGVNFLPTGVGNWGTNSNWQTIAISPFPPTADFEEYALIASGGTAQVTDTRDEVGGMHIVDGAVEILSGGNLTARVSDLGTTTGGVLIDSGGRLSVFSGGTLQSVSATNNGALQTVGPNNAYTVTGDLALNAGGSLAPQITAANHGDISVGGTASLGGSLDASFSGLTPTVGNTWDLVTATGGFSGGFSSVSVTGATLGEGAVAAANINGNTLQLAIQQRLILNVNRETGIAEIRNSSASTVAFDINGYAVQSAVGSLGPGGWNSFQNQALDGGTWSETGGGGTANAIAELNATSSGMLAAGAARSLGPIYDPNFVTFGQETEDYEFTFKPAGAQAVQGVVQYIGDKQFNNIVLTVDPTTGEANMRNESEITVDIQGYTVSSAGGGLLTSWNSLEDQGAEGGLWLEANPKTDRVSEVMSSGATTLSQNAGFPLGTLFNTASAQDLLFEFLLAGESSLFGGEVVYGPLPLISEGLIGDYNNDRIVNAADYTLWRNNVGTMNVLANDPLGGTIGEAQYDQWVMNFGNTLGSGAGSSAIPEPTCLWLMTLAALMLSACRLARP